VVYTDYECPHCALLHSRLAELSVRECVRHFPVKSKHPRSGAAALQGAFWEMHDALFADQGRLEDPHLWARAERLGLDVARFDADRRSEAIVERVRAEFRSGVRAGVVTTPTVFTGGRRHAGPLDAATLRGLLSR
jgi:protein-disulfide isomerase